MSNFFAGRSGLAVRDNGGRVGKDDLNQLVDSLLATKRILLDVLGGEAIYAGGALRLADLPSGTSYPPVTLAIADDSGYLWPFKTSSNTAIIFNVTSTAAGEARLYAVPLLLPGVSPIAADSRYNQVQFIADDVANAAPANSLLLGSGTITASAFVAYTAADLDPATPKIENQGLHGWPINASSGYDVTLSYSYANRQLTITPTGASFDVWTKGIKRTYTGAQVTTAHANTTGQYFIYYDANGALTVGTGAWDLYQHVPIAEVYYNTTQGDALVFSELHTSQRSPGWHQEQHSIVGAKADGGFDTTGFTLDTDTDASKQGTIAAGIMYDEDIKHTLGPVPVASKYTVLYRSGTSEWRWDETATLPFKAGTYLQYNLNTGGTWSLADAASGDFINYWAFVVPTLDGVNQIVFIPGQVKYATQAAAEGAVVSSLSFGTPPSPEFAPLYRMTYKLLAGYTSTGKCRLMSIARIIDSASSLTLGSSTGNVVGPASSVDANLPSFAGTTGKVLQDSGIASADVARLGTAQAFTARKTFTNGLLALVADTKFGPPVSGTYAVGDRWKDAACSEWVCTVAGTPGTWVQCNIGIAATWTGGGAADITTAANWNGGALLSGYKVFDASTAELQVFTYNGTVWLGHEYSVGMNPGTGFVAAGYSASTNVVLAFTIPAIHDVIITGVVWQVTAATADASNKWTMDLRYSGATSILTLTKDSNGNSYIAGTPTATVLNTATHRWLYIELTKGGSPANITQNQVTLTCRYVRK